MLQMKKISEMYGMKAFTEGGDFFGTIEEVIITHSPIHSWRMISVKNSLLNKLLGNAKGVIVPHNLIKAVGDIIIIDNNALPSNKED